MLDWLYEFGIELIDIFRYCVVASIPLFIVIFPICLAIPFIKHLISANKEGDDDEC